MHCRTAAAEDAVAAAVDHAVVAAAVAAAAFAKTHERAQQLLVELRLALQTQHPHHVPLSFASQQHHAWPAAEGLLA